MAGQETQPRDTEGYQPGIRTQLEKSMVEKAILDYRKLYNIPASKKNLGLGHGVLKKGSKTLEYSRNIVESGRPDALVEVFQPIVVAGRKDAAWLRNTDSEYKILNRIANEFGAVRGQVYNDVTGTILIGSEWPYCVSYRGIIHQFHAMFPKVEIILIDGIK